MKLKGRQPRVYMQGNTMIHSEWGKGWRGFVSILVNWINPAQRLAGIVVKNPPAKVTVSRDVGLILGSGRSPRVGNGNPLQYCLENSTVRRAWWATVHDVTKSQIWLNIAHADQRSSCPEEQWWKLGWRDMYGAWDISWGNRCYPFAHELDFGSR